MKEDNSYYRLFFRFIEKYGPGGFTQIDDRDPLMIELNHHLEKNKQFFYIGDLVLFKIIYTSKQCMDILGVDPAELSPMVFYQRIHPDELEKDNLGRALLIKLAHDLYHQKRGFRVFSTIYKMRNAKGDYSNYLMQFYTYFTSIPYQSVFTLKVQTNIDRFNLPKLASHYYLGDDLNYFVCPDLKLLTTKKAFSNREFEVIKLLEQGYKTHQIAQKLFLSPKTVNTHRRNLLAKSGKANMAELIHDLKVQGLL